MKIKHENGCEFKKFLFEITVRDPDNKVPEQYVCVSEKGFEYDYDLNRPDDRNYRLDFSFCPVCGVSIKTKKPLKK